MKKFEPLRIQNSLPTVFDDSLTFYEAIGKLVAKVNELISYQTDTVVKKINEIINDRNDKVAEKINAHADYMNNAIKKGVNSIAEWNNANTITQLGNVVEDVKALNEQDTSNYQKQKTALETFMTNTRRAITAGNLKDVAKVAGYDETTGRLSLNCSSLLEPQFVTIPNPDEYTPTTAKPEKEAQPITIDASYLSGELEPIPKDEEK